MRWILDPESLCFDECKTNEIYFLNIYIFWVSPLLTLIIAI